MNQETKSKIFSYFESEEEVFGMTLFSLCFFLVSKKELTKEDWITIRDRVLCVAKKDDDGDPVITKNQLASILEGIE